MALQRDQNNDCMAATKQKILCIMENRLVDWFNIINSFGMDYHHYQNWCDQFVEEISDTTTECVASVAQRRDALLMKIELLLEKCQQLCKQLSIKLPQFESSAEGLYQDEANLIKHVTRWQEEIDKRMVEVAAIKDERDALCAQLTVNPFHMKENPLPNENELNHYRQNVIEMEMEKSARIEEQAKLCDQIVLIIEKIEYKPRTTFEQDLVSRNNNSEINVTAEYMTQLRNFHEEISNRHESIKVDIKALLEQLADLWKILEEDPTYCKKFVESHTAINLTNLEEIKIELQRCQEYRRNNLKKFIDALRVELVRLWNAAGYTIEQREYFRSMINDEFYTEDLLTIHEMAIKNMKEYLKRVEDILELLKKRGELYEQMQVLVQNSKDPDRYKNRGGQLLKEEKARRAVAKKIPDIEEKLEHLAAQYEINHGKPFLYNGESISDLISSSRENMEQEKKLLSSARKQKREPMSTMCRSVTRTGPYGLLTPQASRLNIRSPLKTPKTAPVKRVVGRRSITKAKLRYSAEKKKRIQAFRAMNATPSNAVDDADYSKFEADLAKKQNSRSTISVNSPHLNGLPGSNVLTTPLSTNRHMDVQKGVKLMF